MENNTIPEFYYMQKLTVSEIQLAQWVPFLDKSHYFSVMAVYFIKYIILYKTLFPPIRFMCNRIYSFNASDILLRIRSK